MRQAVYALIIAGGLIAGLVSLIRWLTPDEPRLDPPQELEQQVLNAPSIEQKARAARDLVRHGTQAAPQVGRLLHEYHEEEPEVMVPLLEAAGKARRWQDLPRLFELMEHPDPRIRGKAGAAARVIMGADYGFRATDPPRKRAEDLARMKLIYREMLPDLKQYYGGSSQ